MIKIHFSLYLFFLLEAFTLWSLDCFTNMDIVHNYAIVNEDANYPIGECEEEDANSIISDDISYNPIHIKRPLSPILQERDQLVPYYPIKRLRTAWHEETAELPEYNEQEDNKLIPSKRPHSPNLEKSEADPTMITYFAKRLKIVEFEEVGSSSKFICLSIKKI